MLIHPFAGHEFGLGNLVVGHLLDDDITGFLHFLETLRGRKGAGNAPDNGPDRFMTGTNGLCRGQ